MAANYQRTITVANPNAFDLTNYIVRLPVFRSEYRAGCEAGAIFLNEHALRWPWDIRIYKDGQPVRFWRDNETLHAHTWNGDSRYGESYNFPTEIYALVDLIPANSSVDLIVRYGDTDIEDSSDFTIFDFASDETLAGWTSLSGTWTTENQHMTPYYSLSRWSRLVPMVYANGMFYMIDCNLATIVRSGIWWTGLPGQLHLATTPDLNTPWSMWTANDPFSDANAKTPGYPGKLGESWVGEQWLAYEIKDGKQEIYQDDNGYYYLTVRVRRPAGWPGYPSGSGFNNNYVWLYKSLNLATWEVANSGNPIMWPGWTGTQQIFGVCPVKVGDTWYGVYERGPSTSNFGHYLATASSIEGPWTSLGQMHTHTALYPEQGNIIYNHKTGEWWSIYESGQPDSHRRIRRRTASSLTGPWSAEAEIPVPRPRGATNIFTPRILWDEDGDRWIMSAGYSIIQGDSFITEVILLFTSVDLWTWTPVNTKDWYKQASPTGIARLSLDDTQFTGVDIAGEVMMGAGSPQLAGFELVGEHNSFQVVFDAVNGRVSIYKNDVYVNHVSYVSDVRYDCSDPPGYHFVNRLRVVVSGITIMVYYSSFGESWRTGPVLADTDVPSDFGLNLYTSSASAYFRKVRVRQHVAVTPTLSVGTEGPGTYDATIDLTATSFTPSFKALENIGTWGVDIELASGFGYAVPDGDSVNFLPKVQSVTPAWNEVNFGAGNMLMFPPFVLRTDWIHEPLGMFDCPVSLADLGILTYPLKYLPSHGDNINFCPQLQGIIAWNEVNWIWPLHFIGNFSGFQPSIDLLAFNIITDQVIELDSLDILLEYLEVISKIYFPNTFLGYNREEKTRKGFDNLSIMQNTVLYLPFFEGLGNKVHDLSICVNNGTIVGTVPWSNSIFGSKCLGFNGGGYVDCGGSSLGHSLDLRNEFTIRVWLKGSNVARSIIEKATSITKEGLQFALMSSPTGLSFLCSTGAEMATLNWTANLLSTRWYHIICTYNGTYLRLICNGMPKAISEVFIGPLQHIEASIKVGGGIGGNYNNSIGLVQLTSSAKTPAESKMIHNSDLVKLGLAS